MKTERLRAPVQWYGGKGNLVKFVLDHLPGGGRPYCEPFCGAASVFFARDPAPVEVLNDLDGNIVNFFRCLQNKETFEELRWRIMYTPYARAEFVRAIELLHSDNDIDRAWAFFVVCNQCVCGSYPRLTHGRWSRAFTSSNGTASTVNTWLMRLSMLDAFRWRLMHAQIDCVDGVQCIRYWDNEDAVFYIDPPYVLDTRKDANVYAVEMVDADHERLVNALLDLKGHAVLSGYEHPIYDRLVEAGWHVVKKKTVAWAAARTRTSGLQGKGAAKAKVPRTECLWIHPRTARKIGLGA